MDSRSPCGFVIHALLILPETLPTGTRGVQNSHCLRERHVLLGNLSIADGGHVLQERSIRRERAGDVMTAGLFGMFAPTTETLPQLFCAIPHGLRVAADAPVDVDVVHEPLQPMLLSESLREPCERIRRTVMLPDHRLAT